MKLKNLLDHIYPTTIAHEFHEYNIQAISSDSRTVVKNCLFIALKGDKFNGADYIADVVNKGATAIAVDRRCDYSGEEIEGVCIFTVDDGQGFLRQAAKKFYQDPSQELKVIGITGTNGKTTVTYLVESIFKEVNVGCGVIGTISYRMGEKKIASFNTTPALLTNQQLLASMVDEGLDYCVMEVSSHALDQSRVDLIDFKVAVFTNLTSDHLDYHKTQANYFLAKSLLFTGLNEDAVAIINIDDTFGRKLISKTNAKVMTCGIENNADVMASDIQMSLSGTEFKIHHAEAEVLIRTQLIGIFNVYNILSAAAVSISQGISLDKIRSTLAKVNVVPGRLEQVNEGQDYTILVDYAHTQDALENVLRTIRAISNLKVITVFGCGGDRDKSKRPEMGRVASELSDFCFVTSDNPRSEEPRAIIDDILKGFEKDNYKIIVDREDAIRKALAMANKGDVVLIAGKGHETYQIFKDGTLRFDEREIIRNILRC